MQKKIFEQLRLKLIETQRECAMKAEQIEKINATIDSQTQEKI